MGNRKEKIGKVFRLKAEGYHFFDFIAAGAALVVLSVSNWSLIKGVNASNLKCGDVG